MTFFCFLGPKIDPLDLVGNFKKVIEKSCDQSLKKGTMD